MPRPAGARSCPRSSATTAGASRKPERPLGETAKPVRDRRPERAATFDVLLDAVRRALEAGALRPGDPLTYSRALWAAVHGVVALAVKLPDFDEATVDDVTELLLGLLGRGMRG